MDNHSINPAANKALDSPQIPPPPSQIHQAASEKGGAITSGATCGHVWSGRSDPCMAGSEAIVAKLKGQYHQPNAGLVLHMLQELQYLLNSWQSEILELEQNIAVVRESGPIVAGWLESEANNPDFSLDSIATISEILQQQNLDYQLCSLDESGEVAARDCPEPEMFGISKALARHQQLRQLIDRKSNLEANIKHTLATLVHLRMEIY